MNGPNQRYPAVTCHQTVPFSQARPVVTLCKRTNVTRRSGLNASYRPCSSTAGVCCKASSDRSVDAHAGKIATASTVIWLLSQLPANAAESASDFSKGSFSTESYVVTLGLFLISLPGQLSSASFTVISESDGAAKSNAKYQFSQFHMGKSASIFCASPCLEINWF